MKLFKILAITLLLTISTANAAPIWAAHFKIKGVFPLADGSVALYFNRRHGSCSGINGHYIRVGENGVNESALKNMLTAALTAAATAKTVHFSFESNTSYCYINRLYVSF